MFHTMKKSTHSSQFLDGLSTSDNQSTGGTRISSPSMSSDNPSFIPDEGISFSFHISKIRSVL